MTHETTDNLIGQIVSGDRDLLPALADCLEENGQLEQASSIRYGIAKKHYRCVGDSILRCRGEIPVHLHIDEEDNRNPRARKRTVTNDHSDIIRIAIGKGGLSLQIDDGGSVANKYGYPAVTQWRFFAALPRFKDGVIEVSLFKRLGEISANKVTDGGIASMVDPLYRPLGDLRFGEAATNAARKLLRQEVLSLFDSVEPEIF